MRPAFVVAALALLLTVVPPARAEDDPVPPAPAPEAKEPPAAKKPARRHHLDIAADRLEHDFGVVGQNEEIETSFTYTNTTKAVIENIRSAADCGCNKADLSHKSLEPGQTGTLTVSFQTAVLSGRLQKRVRIWTKDRSRGELVLRLRISIVRGLILDPGAVSFRDVVHGSTPTAQFGVKWFEGAGKPFKVTKIEIPGHEEQFETRVAAYVPTKKDDSWRGFVVDVQFVKPPPLGMYSAHVLVRTTHPDFPRLELPLSANVVGRVWMQARVLHFGVVEQGASRTATLKFKPNDTSTLFGEVRVRARQGKLQVEAKPDPRHRDKGLWILKATVPEDASEGRLDDEIIELHTGVRGEELILVQVRGRVRARRG